MIKNLLKYLAPFIFALILFGVITGFSQAPDKYEPLLGTWDLDFLGYAYVSVKFDMKDGKLFGESFLKKNGIDHGSRAANNIVFDGEKLAYEVKWNRGVFSHYYMEIKDDRMSGVVHVTGDGRYDFVGIKRKVK